MDYACHARAGGSLRTCIILKYNPFFLRTYVRTYLWLPRLLNYVGAYILYKTCTSLHVRCTVRALYKWLYTYEYARTAVRDSTCYRRTLSTSSYLNKASELRAVQYAIRPARTALRSNKRVQVLTACTRSTGCHRVQITTFFGELRSLASAGRASRGSHTSSSG